ncbi:gamma-glutamyltranspeptidase 1-like protein [Labeo rohita]|uniref:Gamma-glutamyltranspeptidase 1-like protein n=2 Tax=Labeo rohita TaxID=84645 RepID=A0A498NHJ1_LABRO|nr:gamma-glutamyltranspeptidase 1-like protein [Labeo rohita]
MMEAFSQSSRISEEMIRSSVYWRTQTVEGRCLAAIVFAVILKWIIRLSDKCYTKAAVAADAGTCSEIGRDILKRKGSAVDAAIAALLCVSLVNAQSVGIGGGAVFTIYNASTGKVETINARETAPMSASENMFGKDPQNAKPGGIITHEDLWGYKPVLNEHALNFTVGKYIFYAPDAPFGGPVLALILNILKGKRPLSSMCPTIILDKHSKQVKMVVGGAGGTNITTSVAQVILNYLFFGYDLQKAVEEPRVQITINETGIEKGFDKSVIDGLMMKKHTIYRNTVLSVVQAIVREEDKVCAESDHRNKGYPAGY